MITKVHSICNQVDQVDGEPAAGEDDHHGNQHLVHPRIPSSLLLSLSSCTRSRNTLGSLSEPNHDLGVADDDGGERHHELGDVGEGSVHKLWKSLPSLLTVKIAIGWIGNQFHEKRISKIDVMTKSASRIRK